MPGGSDLEGCSINIRKCTDVGSEHGLTFTDPAVSLPGESIKTVCFPGIRKSDTQTRHERGVEDDSCTLISRGQVHGRDSPNALAIEDNVLGTHAISAENRGYKPSDNGWGAGMTTTIS